MFLLAQALAAQDEVALGERIFAKSCAIGYCHGSGGAAGRAPRIQGRSFTSEYLLKVTREGIPGTAMPGWQGRLSEEEIRAVVAYMLSISASGRAAVVASGPSTAPAAVVQTPPDAKAGRELFFDAVRGTRCGTCHALEDRGVPVGPNLAASPPRSIGGIRNPPLAEVRTARVVDGDEFPALPVEEKDGWVKLYDLTVPPPGTPDAAGVGGRAPPGQPMAACGCNRLLHRPGARVDPRLLTVAGAVRSTE